MTRIFVFSYLLFLLSILAFAQHEHGTQAQAPPSPNPQTEHTAMDHSQHVGMEKSMKHDASTLILQTLHRSTAGTSVAPLSTPLHMFMREKWGWNWMLHGQVFVTALQQSGPRGADKVFSSNWFMPMAQKDIGPGRLTFKTMLSFEPATVTDRRYPLLFQTGEVAFGKPLVDAQHPHDLVGELAGVYDWKLRDDTLLSFYGGIIGDPALGPESFPHRLSAAENPLAPLGHHLQDSSHIASDVVTVGITHRFLRAEASGFHGREPNENRWNFDQGAIDSWSMRLSATLGKNWSAQISTADLHSPEELHADEDIRRTTASLHYNRPFGNGNWSNMLLWGRNNVNDHFVLNSYLAESSLRFADKNYVWTRLENVDRTNELTLGMNGTPPPSFHEEPFARIQSYALGYSRDVAQFSGITVGLGGQVNWYGIPDRLRSSYGDHPRGGLVFVRFRPAAH